jgi:hypothetical protein
LLNKVHVEVNVIFDVVVRRRRKSRRYVCVESANAKGARSRSVANFDRANDVRRNGAFYPLSIEENGDDTRRLGWKS